MELMPVVLKNGYSELGKKRYRQLRAIFKSLKMGSAISLACKAANMTPQWLWSLRVKNPRLNHIIKEFINSRVQFAEDQLFKNVLAGNQRAIEFYLCNKFPLDWHNISDIKNIIMMQAQLKKEDSSSVERFKEAPRFIFTAAKDG
jgi:hypothetical protein